MKPLEITKAERELLSENTDVLRRVASFQYHETLSQIMETDVFTCGPECEIRDAAAQMARRRISSVVVLDADKQPLGIVTERDMVKKVVACGPDKTPPRVIGEIMTHGLVSLSPNDTLFDALSVLARHEIKHLPIVSNGRLTGIITMRQLLKIRHFEPALIIGELEEAYIPAAYKAIRDRLGGMADEKLLAGADPVDVVTMISLINADIHRRLLTRTIRGMGAPPPVDFSLFITGSHGRRENLLFPDQDFGFVLDDFPDEDHRKIDEYFIELSLQFSKLLDESGFPFCTGYVMGQNPFWRKRVSEWRRHLQLLVDRQHEHTIRYITLIFDARHLYGQRKLFRQFQDAAFERLGEHHEILRGLHEEEGSHQVPLGLFGGFITERGGNHRGAIDMKRSALIFIIEAARVLALRHGIRETSTIGRLQALVKKGVIHRDDSEYFENAYRIILGHTLKAQIDTYRRTGETGYYLFPKDLSDRKREILKEALKALARLQELVGSEFGELIM